MIDPRAKVYPITNRHGFDVCIVMTPTPKLKGWRWDIRAEGRSVASGWSAGRERDARADADAQLTKTGFNR